MAKEMNWPAILTVAVVCLLLGGFIGALAFPTEKQVMVEKKVNVPVEVIKYVNVTTVVPAPNVLDQALATFLKAVEDEEDQAGHEIDLLNGYDFDEISVNKVYDEYNISYDNDQTIIEFEVRLKYKEAGKSYEKETYNVRVTYEEEEDSIVEIL